MFSFSKTFKTATVFCLFVLLSFIFSHDAKASHIVGGDAYYTCLGNNQYQVTFALYRDCNGISMDPNLFVTVSAPAGCGSSFNVTLQPGTRFGVEITPVCPAQLPSTTCANSGGSIQGTQVYEYTGIITLPAACDMWTISYTTCCRNGNITNGLPNSMYIETRINNTNGLCNNSARFTSLPTPYICNGQLFNFNHGAVDIDGDSLIYSLISPLETSATTFYTFSGGASATQPFFTTPPNSLVFSSTTGQMSFTPGVPQTSVTAIRVYEIRNGDTIGVTMRDIQVVVLNNCSNQSVQGSAPIVSSGGTFDSTSRSFVVCQCTNLNFVIRASDPDGDTLTLNSQLSNISTVFGPGNVTIFPFYPIPTRRDTLELYVQIRTCNAPLGVNGFTIVITDNACPIPLPVYLGFNVIIPGINIIASDTIVCAGIGHNIQLGAQTFSTTNSTVGGTYSWLQASGPPSTLSATNINNPVLTIPPNTVPGDSIVLVAQFTTTPDPTTGASCVTSDTVTIRLLSLPLNVTVAASDSSLCQNGLANTVNFNTSATGPGINLTSGIYTWTSIPSTRIADLSSTSVQNPIGQIAGTAGDSASYIVQYSYGACVGRDTVEVFFNPGVAIATPATANICPGDTIQLSAVLSDTFVTYNPICDDYTQSVIPYAPIAGAGISSGLTCDDCLSATFPIGFNFDFYCTTYSQFKISSNGFITFDLASFANGCCTGQTLPNATTPNNLIALLWEDLNPGTCGSYTYFTTGVAPNRRLCVNLNNVCFFGSTTSTVSGQIVLHETTNIIDMFINTMNPPSTFDLMTMGLENATGLFGESVPGRNSQNYTIPAPEGRRFTPVPNAVFAPITYQWAPNTLISNDTIRNPQVYPSGNITYYVTVSEGNCPMVDSVNVTVNSTIPAPTVTCGTPVNYPTEILFTWGGSAGATGWEYSIDSGATFVTVPLSFDSLLLTGYGDGDCFQIQVRATGPSGFCPTNAATLYTCCTQPCINPTQINSTAFANLSCNGANDGSITYLGTQGDLGPYYTFTLFNALNGTQITGPDTTSNSFTYNNLPAGSYYVRGFDLFGCAATSDTVVITEPAPLVASLVGTTLTSCWNTSDGSAEVNQVGGTSPYTYLWNDINNQTTALATGLSLGTYQSIIIDANGCRDTVTNINVFGPFAQAPLVTYVVNPSSGCPGNGNATILSVQSMSGDPNPGGPGSLTYQWSDASGNSVGGNVLTVNNLIAGNYYLTVTDTSGCVFIDTFNISGATVSIDNAIVNNAACNFSNGNITLQVSGDPLGYNYLWSNGETTANLSGLGGGIYTVTVTGVSGCQDSASYSILSAGLTAIVSSLDERVCIGDSTGYINLSTTSFGTGNVTFQWSNGATTQNISGLAAGNYSVTVTLNGTLTCVANPLATIREPNPMFVNPSIVSCGNITTSAIGGWATYYGYTWSNGDTTSSLSNVSPGTYIVTLTDAEGCTSIDSVSFNQINVDVTTTVCGIIDAAVTGANGANTNYLWNNGETTSTISSVPAGTYTVTVSDAIGCTATDNISFTQINTVANALSCGNLDVTVTGANGSNLTYLWSNGATTNVLNNVPAGTYGVTVIDPLGCTSSSSVSFTQITTSTQVTGCGDINTNASGSNGTTVNYLWSNGSTNASLSSVPAGTYTVTITDNLGCFVIDTASFTQLNVNASIVSCSNLDATVTGANGAITYLWSNGETTNSINNVAAGNYDVTVTDALGCSANSSVSFSYPSLNPYFGNTPGLTVDSIFSIDTIAVSAGLNTPENGVTYTWSPDTLFNNYQLANTTTVGEIARGNYLLIINADNGVCQSTDTIYLTVNSLPFLGLPNAFSPNTDNVNDNFRPLPYPLIGVEIIEFKVFNKWGQVVFDSKSDAEGIEGWDGTYEGADQPRDVYMYVFSYRIRGESETKILRGNVTLLR